MTHSLGPQEQRRELRIHLELPVLISIGTQLTLQGQLKDLSLKSAFIKIKNSVFLETNEEVGITIQVNGDSEVIQAAARISRMVKGEGFAVYFTKIEENSLANLKKLLQKTALPASN